MTASLYFSELDQLLSEDPSVVAARAVSSYDDLAAPFGDRMVLFGAGGLGRKTLAGLHRKGIAPLAYADNNQSLWFKQVDGLTVLPPHEAADRFGRSAAFVVSVWGSSGHRYEQSRTQLLKLGCERVLSFGHLYWKHSDVFLPYFGLDLPQKTILCSEAIRGGLGLWSDDASSREYVAQVRWRLHLDFAGLSPRAQHAPYFPEGLFTSLPDEVFVDCGAFDGDTLKDFLQVRGNAFHQAVALEPDPTNCGKLKAWAASLENSLQEKIQVLPIAAAQNPCRLRFQASGTMTAGSSVDGEMEVAGDALDNVLAQKRPTYLKMDIEGAEPDALLGARKVIEANRPVLAICVYHRYDHLWELPLLIRSLVDDYCFFLRPHQEEVWDLVCYAIPKDRLCRPRNLSAT